MAQSILSQACFHIEEAAYEFVEKRLWPHGPVCPKCGVISEAHYKLQGNSTRIGVRKCFACRKPFTVKVGTIFESSHIPLRLWLQAIYLIASSKKGISSNQLHRTLGITLKSAWFMSHRIREAMGDEVGLLGGGGGIVEADETYMTRRKGPRSGEDHASPVQVTSLVSRDGKTRSFHVANVDGDNLKAILLANIKADTHLMTDGAIFYRSIGRNFARHEWVNHTQGQYAKDSEVPGIRAHSNTVESYFAILKRGIVGTFHHVSEAHLQRYLNEFDFRFTNRQTREEILNPNGNKWEMRGPSDIERADKLLLGVKGKRLTYKTVAQ